MISKQELQRNRQFRCPHCGNIHDISEAYLRAVLVSQDSEMSFRGNHYVDKISSSYVDVRFCPKCKSVRTRNKIIRHVSYFTLMPIVIMAIISLCNWSNCFSWKGYFIYIAVLFIFYVPAVKIFRELISPGLNKGILKRAVDGNAIG